MWNNCGYNFVIGLRTTTTNYAVKVQSNGPQGRTRLSLFQNMSNSLKKVYHQRLKTARNCFFPKNCVEVIWYSGFRTLKQCWSPKKTWTHFIQTFPGPYRKASQNEIADRRKFVRYCKLKVQFSLSFLVEKRRRTSLHKNEKSQRFVMLVVRLVNEKAFSKFSTFLKMQMTEKWVNRF